MGNGGLTGWFYHVRRVMMGRANGGRGERMRAWAMMAGLALAATGPATADVKKGVDAWAKGDFRAAVEEWRGPAVAGDADAQFNMGQAYKLGRGVPVDPTLAESWFRKAALQGHPQAEINYGLALFQAGRKAEAAPWLERGVARDEARAQLVLGTMIFNGDGVTRDYPRAYALMTRASQQGMKSASETLAQMDGYVSPADKEKGLALARQYAAQTRVAALPSSSTSGRSQASAPAAPVASPRPSPAPSTSPATPSRAVAALDRPAARRPSPPLPASPAAAPGGGWRIQLGAFRDRGNAEALWTRVRGRLGRAQPDYPASGGLVRLQATGFASRADANRACAATGVSCVVVAP